MEIQDNMTHGTHHKEYASKGVAGAGLGLGIDGTALWLLNGGGLNLFGNRPYGCGGGYGVGSPMAFDAWNRAVDSEIHDQKALYDYALLDASARYNDRQQINSEIFGTYKSQIDADFGLYKNQRDQFDILSNRIGKLETAAAVNAAVDPWRSKVLQMQIDNVAGMVNLEAERRCCADNSIVNYVNTTFYPKLFADVTVGTETTSASIYNPIPRCGCCNQGSNL